MFNIKIVFILYLERRKILFKGIQRNYTGHKTKYSSVNKFEKKKKIYSIKNILFNHKIYFGIKLQKNI